MNTRTPFAVDSVDAMTQHPRCAKCGEITEYHHVLLDGCRTGQMIERCPVCHLGQRPRVKPTPMPAPVVRDTSSKYKPVPRRVLNCEVCGITLETAFTRTVICKSRCCALELQRRRDARRTRRAQSEATA